MFTPPRRSLIYIINGLIVFSLVLGGLAPVGMATPTGAAGETKAASARMPAAQGEQGGEETAPNQAAPAAEAPEGGAYVGLSVSGPETVGAGMEETLTMRVTNLGPSMLRRARLELEHSGPVEFVGRTAYPLPDLEIMSTHVVEVRLRVQAEPGAEAEARVRLVGGNVAEEKTGVYTAVVRQEEVDEWRPGTGAGRWRPGKGRLEVELGEGRDEAISRVTHRAVYGRQQLAGLAARFELSAYDEQGEEVAGFEQPVVLRWSYRGVVPDEQAGWLRFVWLNPETARWEAVPTRRDEMNGVIEAEVAHFSTYRTQVDPPQYAAPRDPFSGLEAELFNGAASYRYAIPLFTRPGGFGPGLALSYSSRRREAHQNFGSSGSLVGWG